MKGTGPKQRAKNLRKELKRIYPEESSGDTEENVTDMLTDLRHVCDEYEISFADCDRAAYNHYLAEIEHPKLTKGTP